MDCPRCEAQGRAITNLARDLAEARIALARCRDLAAGVKEGPYSALCHIVEIAASCLPIDVDREG